ARPGWVTISAIEAFPGVGLREFDILTLHLRIRCTNVQLLLKDAVALIRHGCRAHAAPAQCRFACWSRGSRRRTRERLPSLRHHPHQVAGVAARLGIGLVYRWSGLF